MKLRQVEAYQGASVRVCLVADDKRLRPGVPVTFKGEEIPWVIGKVYETTVDHDAVPRGWHVGGL